MNEKQTFTINPKNPIDKQKLRNILIGAFVVIFAIIFASTCFYTVDDKQQAVVTTFGKVTDVTDAGVHFKIPFGVQKAHKVDVNVYQKIELGYTTDDSKEGYTVNTAESTMITGDYNIVNIDFFVEYKVSDPVAYLFSSNKPEEILRIADFHPERIGTTTDSSNRAGCYIRRAPRKA